MKVILDLGTDGGEWWSALGPGHLPPGREPLVPIRQEAEWDPKVSLCVVVKRKIAVPAGKRTLVIQPIANHCTDLALVIAIASIEKMPL